MNPQKKIVPFAVFFAVAHPETFKLTRRILGSWISSAEGLPTTLGLLLHALVFVIVCSFVWRAVYGGRKSGYEPEDLSEFTPSPAPAPATEAVSRDYTNLFSSILGNSGMNNFDN